MGATKSEHFSAKQNAVAGMLKALAHPARVAIFEHLLKIDGCICNDLVAVLPLAQPTVSQHLKELKLAGLIKGSIEGNAVCYCIDERAVKKLQEYFAGITKKIESKINCC